MKESYYAEGLGEDPRAWFGKGKKGGAGGGGWVNKKGERIGKCGDSSMKASPNASSQVQEQKAAKKQ